MGGRVERDRRAPGGDERLDALEKTMQPTLDRYAGQPDLASRFIAAAPAK